MKSAFSQGHGYEIAMTQLLLQQRMLRHVLPFNCLASGVEVAKIYVCRLDGKLGSQMQQCREVQLIQSVTRDLIVDHRFRKSSDVYLAFGMKQVDMLLFRVCHNLVHQQ